MTDAGTDDQSMTGPVVTRFAPSPTGRLHLGHAYAAIVAHDLAHASGGTFLVRIEDIDRDRCRAEFEQAIFDDLNWLGLSWAKPVWRQSERLDAYRAAVNRLDQLGLTYPCFCTRAEIRDEIARMTAAPHAPTDGPDGPIYPGTCRALPLSERRRRLAAGDQFALRLDCAGAAERVGDLVWDDALAGPQSVQPGAFGDIVIARKDIATSYHLAVTVDDADQGVTLITRGNDLFSASHIHRTLQALLELPVPRWNHHALVVDADGNRLAKRAAALSIDQLRRDGHSPADIRRLAAASLAGGAPHAESLA